MPGYRASSPSRRALLLAVACVLAAGPLALGGCGGGSGGRTSEPGTVFIRNDSNQGMAPLTVSAFFLGLAGSSDPGPNLLAEEVLPGAIVIVGQFPPGEYFAEAVLASGGSLLFEKVIVAPRAPTNVVIPVL